jgi:hypothetical protein
MHGSFDRSGETNNRTDRSWIVGLLSLPLVVALVLCGLAMTQPAAFKWISEAAQAEFVGADLPEAAPTQLAQPVGAIRAAGVN